MNSSTPLVIDDHSRRPDPRDCLPGIVEALLEMLPYLQSLKCSKGTGNRGARRRQQQRWNRINRCLWLFHTYDQHSPLRCYCWHWQMSPACFTMFPFEFSVVLGNNRTVTIIRLWKCCCDDVMRSFAVQLAAQLCRAAMPCTVAVQL